MESRNGNGTSPAPGGRREVKEKPKLLFSGIAGCFDEMYMFRITMEIASSPLDRSSVSLRGHRPDDARKQVLSVGVIPIWRQKKFMRKVGTDEVRTITENASFPMTCDEYAGVIVSCLRDQNRSSAGDDNSALPDRISAARMQIREMSAERTLIVLEIEHSAAADEARAVVRIPLSLFLVSDPRIHAIQERISALEKQVAQLRGQLRKRKKQSIESKEQDEEVAEKIVEVEKSAPEVVERREEIEEKEQETVEKAHQQETPTATDLLESVESKKSTGQAGAEHCENEADVQSPESQSARESPDSVVRSESEVESEPEDASANMARQEQLEHRQQQIERSGLDLTTVVEREPPDSEEEKIEEAEIVDVIMEADQEHDVDRLDEQRRSISEEDIQLMDLQDKIQALLAQEQKETGVSPTLRLIDREESYPVLYELGEESVPKWTNESDDLWQSEPAASTVERHRLSTWIATGSADATVRVWDLDRRECIHTLKGHNAKVECLQFEQNMIVSGGFDNLAKSWDPRTGECLNTFKGHSGFIWCLQFVNNNLVTGSADNTLILWDLQTGKELRRFRHHTGWVSCLQLKDGTLVSGSYDKTVVVWDFSTGKVNQTFEGHTGWVRSVSFEGWRLCSGADDNSIRLWDMRSGDCVESFSVPRVIASARAGGNLLVASEDLRLRLMDLDTGEMTTFGRGHQSKVETVAASGRLALSGSWDSTCRIWDVLTGECLHVMVGHGDKVRVGVFVSNTRVVTGADDCTIREWDTETGLCLFTHRGHRGPVKAIDVCEMPCAD